MKNLKRTPPQFRYISSLLILLFSMFNLKAQIGPEEETVEAYEGYYLDGFDTVFIAYEDSLVIEERLNSPIPKQTVNKIKNYNLTNEYMPSGGSYIILLPEYSTKNLNENLFGVNLTGMFGENKLPYEPDATYSPTSELQWGWLSDLKPDVVRFPGGAFSKFMHLLTDVETGLKSQGYGYNLEEIIRYFDWTDEVDEDQTLDNPVVSEIADDDPSNAAVVASWTWIDIDHRSLFANFLEEWQLQETLDEGTNYLDDFIHLIEKIETENDDYKVDVVVCLNILSETAQECRNIIEYLRTENDIWDVNVVGVELGNECYSKFHCDAMGFKHFDDPDDEMDEAHGDGNYWDYVNGDDYGDATAQGYLEQVLSDDMQETDAHNFINEFKGDASFDCKVGVPGAPLSTAVLKPPMSGCIYSIDWNDEINDHYTDYIDLGVAGENPKFDAVILHLYYDDSEWGDIPQSNLDLSYDDGIWDYDTYDARLVDAFDGIMG